jgi:formimidoylglutamate deiminase
MTALFCEWAYLPDGWRADTRVEIGADGRIAAVTPETTEQPGDVRLPNRLILPAASNLHSHAFQRAMAGHAERKSAWEDSFWTWREAMYGFVERLTPGDVEAIAAFAYMEMLEAGYAAVGEFHYLHHAPGGASYEDPAEMAHRVAAAAEAVGIGLTLLPVLYSRGGVRDEPLNARQNRFGCDIDRYAALHGAIRLRAPDATLGVTAHSLRAVRPEDLEPLARDFGDGPIHIHVAEQMAEVLAVEAAMGARPVAWLLDNADLDARWCLIHATHMTPAETEGLAASGAVAGLCPVTEANLGDGIFDGARYIARGGTYGIGTDSHVRIGLTEELRVLEYSQRLRDLRRTVLRTDPGSIGAALYGEVLRGGAQAVGRESGALEPGSWADIVALDAAAIVPFVPGSDHWLDHWIFVAGDAAIRDVWSAGRHRVTDGRHVRRDEIEARFKARMAGLMRDAA